MIRKNTFPFFKKDTTISPKRMSLYYDKKIFDYFLKIINKKPGL